MRKVQANTPARSMPDFMRMILCELIGITGLSLISYAIWLYGGEAGVCLFVGSVLLLVGLLSRPGKSKDGS